MGPVGKVRVEQALVAAVEAAVRHRVLHQAAERFQVRLVHVHARVEAVGPTDVRSGRQFLPLEQLVAVPKDQGVRVQEDALLVLREAPAVQLCECDAQLGTLQQGQVAFVLRVEQVDLLDQVEHCAQFVPENL